LEKNSHNREDKLHERKVVETTLNLIEMVRSLRHILNHQIQREENWNKCSIFIVPIIFIEVDAKLSSY